VLECVINISEGSDRSAVEAIAAAAGPALLDVHSDADHNRSVLTLAGTDAARAVTATAVARLDLTAHTGAHPRIGVVDVVPFVPLAGSPLDEAIAARDDFSAWAGTALGLPCFRYGPERSLPDVRRGAFDSVLPDTGPDRPHPTAGGCAVGARPLLVAYNLWLAEPDLAVARRLARELRGPAVRALGLAVGRRVQVSMNLLSPADVGPADVFDRVASQVAVAGAELVGLVPAAVLDAVPRRRWAELDLSEDRTIEARLSR
jgi:glutamate formiminotransferase